MWSKFYEEISLNVEKPKQITPDGIIKKFLKLMNIKLI
jgi:hypothetical protein